MEKNSKKIGVIHHYRVLIERFHWNFGTMDFNVSAKVKKMKDLDDGSIPSDLIEERDDAKKRNGENDLQRAYDNIASFNRRYKLTVAIVKHSNASKVANFRTELSKTMNRQLSAKEVGLLVASFYSDLSKIDHNVGLEDKIIDWKDEDSTISALKSWTFEGPILSLAIAFHRFRKQY